MWEVWEQNDSRATTAATSKLKKRAGSVNLVRDLEDIARRSKAAQPQKTTLSKAEKVKGITDNKRAERQHERQKKSESKDEPLKESSVTTLHETQERKRKSYKLPTSMKKLLKEESGDE